MGDKNRGKDQHNTHAAFNLHLSVVRLNKLFQHRFFTNSPEANLVPISGLVVTFIASQTSVESLRQTLQVIPEIEVGECSEHRMAIVVDSASRQRDREIWEQIQQLPGVSDINVAFVGFDETDPKSD